MGVMDRDGAEMHYYTSMGRVISRSIFYSDGWQGVIPEETELMDQYKDVRYPYTLSLMGASSIRSPEDGHSLEHACTRT